MPAPRKIQSIDEVRRWYTAGWTFAKMAEEHEKKYGIPVKPQAFSNLRSLKGWDRRITRDDQLIPWSVKPEHKHRFEIIMLRFEARRRDGRKLATKDARRVDAFLKDLEELNAVVHYDPETEEGFHLIPREAQDEDIVRQPSAKLRTHRRNAG